MRTPTAPLVCAFALGVCLHSIARAQPHNLILFVPDGLRSQVVDSTTAPTFARLRAQGVDFINSHSLVPTFTTANASAFATGHLLGDTGDFSNSIYTGFPVQSSGGNVTPFLEANPVLRELSEHFHGNYLNEDALVGVAQSLQFSTAVIGKLGPVAIFDLGAMREAAGDARTLIIDDSTGRGGGIPIPPDWLAAIRAAGLKPEAPGRGDNANAGDNKRPGTWVANYAQQQYFLELTLKVVLPRFKAANRPFVLVYWSRDPDGSQHNQGDSLGKLVPGINGPTSMAGIRAADSALAAIEQGLGSLGLAATTNIVVAADHGFSTVSKASKTSSSTRRTYSDVNPGELPPGFVAIDLADALQRENTALKLFDPDAKNAAVDWKAGQHSRRGNGLIGQEAASAEVIVAANGGSDLIYLTERSSKKQTVKLAKRIVEILLTQDYVSGIFVDAVRFGAMPGALSLADIGLEGSAITPTPAIVVNFSSFGTGCAKPELCAAEVSDSALQQGQGMHGSFSRADTWNFMAARGPDFRTQHVSTVPASNADIGMTLVHLLGLNISPKGKLTGRVLTESLASAASTAAPAGISRTLRSKPAANGLMTVLKTQSVGSYTYIDAAGFPGRTVGLE